VFFITYGHISHAMSDGNIRCVLKEAHLSREDATRFCINFKPCNDATC